MPDLDDFTLPEEDAIQQPEDMDHVEPLVVAPLEPESAPPAQYDDFSSTGMFIVLLHII